MEKLWIDGLSLFHIPSFTYPYLFRKKSRRNQRIHFISLQFQSTISVVCFAPFKCSSHHWHDCKDCWPTFPVSFGIRMMLSLMSLPYQRNEAIFACRICEFDTYLKQLPDMNVELEFGVHAAPLQLAARRSGIGSVLRTLGQIFALKSALTECDCHQN
jgi:hypothetical protein